MNMTRKGFLAALLGLPTVNSLPRKAPGPLLFAEERERIPSRAAKIRDIEILPYSLQQREAIRIALSTPLTTDNVFVRLRTEEGVIGIGEAAPYSAVTSETQQTDVAMGHSLAEVIRGQD